MDEIEIGKIMGREQPLSQGAGPKFIIENVETKDKQVLIQDQTGSKRFISFEDYEGRKRIAKLAESINGFTLDELLHAHQLNRSISEFEEDVLSHLERLNNQVLLKNDHLRKHGMA